MFVEKEFVAMVPDYLVAKFQLKTGVDVPQDILGEIVEEAEKYSEKDKKFKEQVEIRNQADQLI